MDDIEKELEQIQNEADLAVFHKNYLSKTGKLTQMLAGLKDMLAEQRAEAARRVQRDGDDCGAVRGGKGY